MAQGMNRVWWVVDQVLGDGWSRNKIGVLAGCPLPPVVPMGRFRDVTDGPERDVLAFLPDRAVIVMPKPATKISLWGAWRASKGDIARIADVFEIPRSRITGFEIDEELPSDIRLMSEGLTFAHISVEDAGSSGRIHFWVDIDAVAPNEIVSAVSEWVESDSR